MPIHFWATIPQETFLSICSFYFKEGIQERRGFILPVALTNKIRNNPLCFVSGLQRANTPEEIQHARMTKNIPECMGLVTTKCVSPYTSMMTVELSSCHSPEGKCYVLSRLSHVWLFADPMNCRPQGSSVHALLQRIFPIQGWNPSLLCLLYQQAGSLPLVPPRKPRRKVEVTNGNLRIDIMKIKYYSCFRGSKWGFTTWENEAFNVVNHSYPYFKLQQSGNPVSHILVASTKIYTKLLTYMDDIAFQKIGQ